MSQQYVIRYDDHEVMGAAIAMQAHRLHLTPEQLIRRVLARELGDVGISASNLKRETSPEKCWINNGALRPIRKMEVCYESSASF